MTRRAKAARADDTPPDFRIATAAAAAMRVAIRLAGGREVCFVCAVDAEGKLTSARAVARGQAGQVLALPGVAQRGEMLVHNHPSGWLEPSDADLNIAARLHDDGVGFGITDNDVTDLYVVTEVPRVAVKVVVPQSSIERDFGPDGPLARGFTSYETRDGQRDMATTIARTYADGGVALLEAGTGVGKSMAYLVPALRWAAANQERTVVSTNTITLQEQLVFKDLPLLADLLSDQPVRFALLKGWRNYLCLSRLMQAQAASASLFEAPQRDELAMLVEWSKATKDGSLSDLPTPPRPDVWDEVAAEGDLCTRLKCSHFDACFVFKARRHAATADVVVVNHSLLLADIAVRRASQNWAEAAVLPAYSHLVVDEGHHLEDAAANHLGSSVSNRAVTKLLNRLERRGGREAKGLLPTLETRLMARGDLLSVASLDLLRARLRPALEHARGDAAQLFDRIAQWLQENNAATIRLTPDLHTEAVWRDGLQVALQHLIQGLESIGENLRLIRERLETEEERDEALLMLLQELRGVGSRTSAQLDALRATLDPPDDAAGFVRWAELRGRADGGAMRGNSTPTVLLYSVPLDLAPILREDLFGRLSSTVVTSATLTADAKFNFLLGRLGLDDEKSRVETALFPSPFDYTENALLVVPGDTPAPNVDPMGHQRAVVGHVLDVAAASDGGLFVLATSHRDVRALAAALRPAAIASGWPLLVHGEDGRDTLLRRFRDSGRAILIGTATFWEGVDVPGHALRGLIITKLPFRVPTEPMVAAQCDAIEARGGDPFMQYMLPHATLRLKQGVGRLIRTATDRGVIVLDDVRVVTKRYGRDLLDALPPAQRVLGPWVSAERRIAAFYAARPAEPFSTIS
ncbi:MAG: helicase C-terminal domain-containing protein [Gemmatimonadota bacterium]